MLCVVFIGARCFEFAFFVGLVFNYSSISGLVLCAFILVFRVKYTPFDDVVLLTLFDVIYGSFIDCVSFLFASTLFVLLYVYDIFASSFVVLPC